MACPCAYQLAGPSSLALYVSNFDTTGSYSGTLCTANKINVAWSGSAPGPGFVLENKLGYTTSAVFTFVGQGTL